MAQENGKGYFELFLVVLLVLISVFNVYAQTSAQTATKTTPTSNIYPPITNAGETGKGIGGVFQTFISWYTPTNIDEQGRYEYDKSGYIPRTIIDLLIFFGIFLSLTMLSLGKLFEGKDGGRAAKGVAVFVAIALDFAIVFGAHTLKIAGQPLISNPQTQSVLSMFFPFAKYFIYIAAFLLVWSLLLKIGLFGDKEGKQGFWSRLFAFIIALLLVAIAFEGAGMLWSKAWTGSYTSIGKSPISAISPVVQPNTAQKWFDNANELYNQAVKEKDKGNYRNALDLAFQAKTSLEEAMKDPKLQKQGIELEKKVDALIATLNEIKNQQQQNPAVVPVIVPGKNTFTAGFCSNTAAPCKEASTSANPYSVVYAKLFKSDGSGASGETVLLVDSAGAQKGAITTDASGAGSTQIAREASKFDIYASYNGEKRYIGPIYIQNTAVKPAIKPVVAVIPPVAGNKCAGYIANMASIATRAAACKSYGAECKTDANYAALKAGKCFAFKSAFT